MRHWLSLETHCVHQRNQDGTVDSICSLCGLTIGRSFDVDVLKALEARHVCQPAERRKQDRIVHRIYDPIKKQTSQTV
jgi:hypothetical protein